MDRNSKIYATINNRLTVMNIQRIEKRFDILFGNSHKDDSRTGCGCQSSGVGWLISSTRQSTIPFDMTGEEGAWIVPGCIISLR